MPDGTMAEMKSYIWVQTTDGSIQQVEEEIAMIWPMIWKEVIQAGKGFSKNHAITLPQEVDPTTLGLILDYCRFHQVPCCSIKELKTFDEKFVRLDMLKLCRLLFAACSLQLKPLVDLTTHALAVMMEGKSPEEMREMFNSPNDLTKAELLEPLRNITDDLSSGLLDRLNINNDPSIRLLNRLYDRKRKELKEREQSKNVEVEEKPVDERSIDDLLLFINGGNGDSKGVRATKNKKKSRRRKDQRKDSSSNNDNGNHKKNPTVDNVATPNQTSKLQDYAAVTCSPELEFGDGDGDRDDELDPAIMEEIDREVEEFERRLNAAWAERGGLHRSL